ncbi:hypothetical protein B0H14DRAFT_2606407 [Mycena olivaceomarginata]|nr:hypothetical protein B0H14DRAFT_2606407 [Mycena olivaceomarginata]
MKHCYKPRDQYVAKRFEIGAGKDEVTMAENISNLEFEAMRNDGPPSRSGTARSHPLAFVHYAFQWSDGNVVFADLQALRSRFIGQTQHKCDGDHHLRRDNPHTGGDSGVGDHGVKGIEKWRDQHDCNNFCKNLDLAVGEDDEEE